MKKTLLNFLFIIRLNAYLFALMGLTSRLSYSLRYVVGCACAVPICVDIRFAHCRRLAAPVLWLLFICGCFPSIVYASSPPNNDVRYRIESLRHKFCAVLDYEQWRRDHPRPAAKRLANLNVGEPRTVRMIYFFPNDRPFQQTMVDSMKVAIRQIQTFFADQMEAHGYGRKTFRFETDGHGEPIVHRVDGQHPAIHYIENFYDPLFEEIEQVFDLSANIYFINRNTGNTAAYGARTGKNSGYALMVGEHVGDAWKYGAHELGHAFGLFHDFRDRAYIMSYGPVRGRKSLSACHAKFLAVHPYFNPDIPDEETPPPKVELISPQAAYPSGSKSVSVQLKVGDSEGIHQVLLFASAAGYGTTLKACRGLEGERDAVVEFEYDGAIPEPRNPEGTGTSLADPLIHSIAVRAVDSLGNVGVTRFSLSNLLTQRNLIATLEGHIYRVTSVSFSPDGTKLASGSVDQTVNLWDVATRTNIATLEPGTSVFSVSFSPDGKTLASGASDGTVNLWNVATKRNIAPLEGHTSVAYSVSFSPDGKTLASGASDGTIKLWDVATRRNTATLEGHTSSVLSVVFSPDSKILASGSFGSRVKLWDVATRTNIATLELGKSVFSVSFSPDGTTLASGAGRAVKLWDVATQTTIATLEGHTSGVYSVSFSPDGTTLASGASDGIVLLWDVATQINIARLGDSALDVTSVVFSPDGTTLASGVSDGTVKLWDVSQYVTPQTPTPAPTPDFDGDRIVGISDFLLFVEQFGFSENDEGYEARFDLDGDGMIGIGDFLIFVDNFGKKVS